MYPKFDLISYKLCPYVQRAVLVLQEKHIPFQRTHIDLSNKPDWFIALSPTGKVPLLQIDKKDILFESSVICEYLDNVTPDSLFASDQLEKAQQKSWIEFGSSILQMISQFYNAASQSDYERIKDDIWLKFQQIEKEVVSPYFSGHAFGMVDATFVTIFRYFDTFEKVTDHQYFEKLEKIQSWRKSLSKRTSYRNAVVPEYPELLENFLKRRSSYIGSLVD